LANNTLEDGSVRSEPDTYDSNGNTVAAEVGGSGSTPTNVVDQYDFRNRLIRRILDDGTVIDYTYNARGTRVAKVKKAGAALISTRLFVVDEQNLTGYVQTLEEWSADGYDLLALDKVYTYGLDLVAQTQFEFDEQSSSFIPHISYFLYDGHGNVRGLADEAGAITDTYTYDAFGIQLEQTGSTENAYRYCGEYFDVDLGFYYLRARHMNPQTGRFWTMDSYEGNSFDPISLHKYLYCHADPVNGIDPSGLYTLSEVMVTNMIVGTLAGATSGWISTGTVKGAGIGALVGLASGAVLGAFTYLSSTTYLVASGVRITSAMRLSMALDHLSKGVVLLNAALASGGVDLFVQLRNVGLGNADSVNWGRVMYFSFAGAGSAGTGVWLLSVQGAATSTSNVAISMIGNALGSVVSNIMGIYLFGED